MSKFKLITIALLLGILLIGCSSDNNEQQPQEDEQPTTETNSDVSEDENGNGENEESDSDSKETSSDNSSGVLSLGETGTVESTIGDYEITFNSFQLLEEMEGESAEGEEVFVLVDAKVTNTGEDSLNGKDLYTASIFSDDGLSAENTFYYESINLFEGTIEPGASMEGQFLFISSASDTYELVYNNSLGALATVLTWEFSADEASN